MPTLLFVVYCLQVRYTLIQDNVRTFDDFWDKHLIGLQNFSQVLC